MKRKILCFLLIVFTVILLSGCNESLEHNNTNITEGKTTWQNNSNLYLIPSNAWNDTQASALYIFNDNLLTAYHTYNEELNTSDFNLCIVDIESGSIIHKTVLSGLEVPEIQLIDNMIAVNDIAGPKACILDAQLNIINEYGFDYNNVAFNSDATCAYVFSTDSGIQVIDLNSNTKKLIYEDLCDFYLCETNGNFANITFINKNTLLKSGGILNLKTGEINFLPNETCPWFIEYTEPEYLIQLHAENNSYCIGTKDNLQLLHAENTDAIKLLNSTSHLLMYSYDEDFNRVLKLFDHNGTYLSSIKLEGVTSELLLEPVWSQQLEGYFLTTIDEKSGSDKLLFWDINKETEGEDLQLSDFSELYNIPEGKEVSAELYTKAKDISEKYGVNILIAEQCDTEYDGYNAELLFSEADIDIALDTIDVTFATFPDGFFEQLKYDSYSTIEVHVNGALSNNVEYENAVDMPEAFVSHEDSKTLLVIDGRDTYFEDINFHLQTTLYHEVSHMIDKRLKFYRQYHDDAIYSDEGWLSLNPEGFEYNNDYNGVLDPAYYGYFIDDYSCSFPTEDRARVLEYAASGQTYAFSNCQGLIDKLDYYCKGIRDGFDTSGWPDETPWEETLTKLK